jgi:hypothetical protein
MVTGDEVLEARIEGPPMLRAKLAIACQRFGYERCALRAVSARENHSPRRARSSHGAQTAASRPSA